MRIIVSQSKQELGARAAEHGAQQIRQAIAERGYASIIVATGASQFEMLSALVRSSGIDWGLVTAFHLDEYAGLDESHPASFRRYLKERFIDQLPGPLRGFHAISGEGNLTAECQRLGSTIGQHQIDLALIGIGENGHLAFNDPPADFETEEPYLIVQLDEACRRQQLGEGWFTTLEAVPSRAISMSIRQIMKSRALVVSVPDRRKAEAVKNSIEGPMTPQVPASILQRHADATVYLDPDSAILLRK